MTLFFISLSILLSGYLVWTKVVAKKEQKKWQQKVEELETKMAYKQVQLEKLEKNFLDQKNIYFEKLSYAFHQAGGIIQGISDKFKTSEELFLSNISSVEKISSSTHEVGQWTFKTKDSVNTLENGTKNLKNDHQDHARIVEMLKDVQGKCKKINDIAFQAHLLSFNAAIEATQAGEHGKGFSVVAEDIGEMADMSKKAANEITKVVNESLNLMVKFSEQVEENIEKTLSGTNSIIDGFSKVDGCMDRITETVDQVNVHADTATSQIKTMGESSKTDLENLNKILSDVIGIVTGREVIDVNPLDAYDSLDNYIVIDVRGLDEWNDELGHIEVAQHICLQGHFKEQIQHFDVEEKYLFVCRSGGRSSRAARIAQAMGFKQVYNLSGGMLEWKKSGLSSVRDMQQVA